jgi:hypothetical protein
LAVPISVKGVILPPGEFAPQDANVIRSLNADPDPVALNRDDGKDDAVADDDLLAGLPTQNQHVTPP